VPTGVRGEHAGRPETHPQRHAGAGEARQAAAAHNVKIASSIAPDYRLPMEKRALGRSGHSVSRLLLGCGSFGGVGSAPELFGRGESEDEAFELMDAAVAAGITVFDTADAYGGGRSEAMIGSWLADRRPEPRPLLSTKIFNPMGEGDDRGLAPARIFRQLDSSLERLGVDHVDMYVIHDWDGDTPIAETLGALDGLVRAGKVRAIAASNVSAEQLEEALEASAEHGLARFEWVQNEYSLLHREPEDGVFALCERHGLGFTPFSPLAGGWLTGKYRRDMPAPAGSRMTLRPEPYEEFQNEATYDAIDRFLAAANARGVEPSVLALAWTLNHPRVTATVIGPRRPEQLQSLLPALDLELNETERAELAELFQR
jgi:aryl-alcohol dehydrogenase-like predicted oxidoreductase